MRAAVSGQNAPLPPPELTSGKGVLPVQNGPASVTRRAVGLRGGLYVGARRVTVRSFTLRAEVAAPVEDIRVGDGLFAAQAVCRDG